MADYKALYQQLREEKDPSTLGTLSCACIQSMLQHLKRQYLLQYPRKETVAVYLRAGGRTFALAGSTLEEMVENKAHAFDLAAEETMLKVNLAHQLYQYVSAQTR